MDAENRTKRPSRTWLIALLALTGLAFAVTLWGGGRSAPVSSQFDAELIWPQSLDFSEPTSIVGVVDRDDMGGLSQTGVILYALDGSGAENIAESVLSGSGLIEIARGEVDDRRFDLIIPPLSEWGGSIVGEDWTDEDDLPSSVDLVMELRLGRDRQYQRKTVSLTAPQDSVVLATTLDRPLYQPGQTMLMRTVAVDARSGAPREEAEIHWRIHDPQGNLVLDRRTETTHSGVSALEFQLADRCLQGNYEISVQSGRARSSQVVAVQPYRLPRFTVAIDAETSTVTPGEPFSFRVGAEYVHGEPVSNADVTLRLSWESWEEIATFELNGESDADGVFVYEWDAPETIRPRTSVRANAVFTTVDGRAEEDSHSFGVSTNLPNVEIYPPGRANFVVEELNQALVVVADADGETLANRRFTVTVHEQEGRRDIELESDDAGRATFEWTPRRVPVGSNFHSVELDVTVEGEGDRAQRVEVGLQRHRNLMRATAPAARVGEPYSLIIEPHEENVFLLRRNQNFTTAAEILPPNSTAYQREINFTDADRGLTHLVIFSNEGIIDAMPVWVRQQGTNVVDINLEETHYAPGDTGWIDLAFPVIGDSPQSGEVTFGVVGVDEALYALKERADVPLEILLRQSPLIMAPLLGLVDVDEDHDEPGGLLAASRFLASFYASGLEADAAGQSITPASMTLEEGRNITGEIERLKQKKLFRIWAIALSLLLYGLIFVVIFLTRKTTTRAAFKVGSTKMVLIALAIGAVIAVTVLAISVQFVLQILAPLSLITVILLLGLCLAATLRDRQFPAVYWFLTCLGLVALAFITMTFVDNHFRSFFYNNEVLVLSLLFFIPIAIVIATCLVWIFNFIENGERITGLILAIWIGALLTLFTGLWSGAFDGAYYETTHEVSSISIGDGGTAAVSAGAMEEQPQQMMEDVAFEEDQRTQRSRDGEEGAQPEGTIRSWFPETMIWRPSVESDADGKARISFPIPDSMTTWRVNAWAHTKDGRFGEGQAQLVVTRPVFLDLNLPTHLTDGDSLRIPATIVNTTDQTISLQLEAEATGPLRLIGPNAAGAFGHGPVYFDHRDRLPRLFEVGPNQRHTISILVMADGVGSGELTVSLRARGGALIDGERRRATVAPHGRTIHDTVSGIIGEGLEHLFEFPQEAIDDTSSVEVVVFPGIVADAMEGLEGMLRQPYGCFEQTSSINFPNIMVLQILDQTEPSQWPGGADAWGQAFDEAISLINLGYQRMLTFQDEDGGFALYPGNTPEAMLTAYGIIQLMAMSEVHNIDEDVIFRAASWLAGEQSGDGSWTSHRQRWSGDELDAKVRTTAFVIMGMLQAASAPYSARAIERGLNFLEENLSSITSNGTLAIVANAFVESDRAGTLNHIFERLAETVEFDEEGHAYWNETGHSWMGGGGVFARVETTAMAAVALLKNNAGSAITGPALGFIAANRSPSGGWGTTQATVWSLMAMQFAGSGQDATLELRLDGEPMAHAAGSERPGRLELDSDVAALSTFFEKITASGSALLSMTASNELSATYRATAEYAIPWTSQAAANQEGLTLALIVADRQMQIHAMQTAIASIRNETDSRQDTLIVELPLPPASFAPRDQFEAMVESGLIDNFEIIPTHVRIYHEGLDPGEELDLEYSFSPMLRGRMNLPPLRAYQFYTPQPLFEADGGEMTVR